MMDNNILLLSIALSPTMKGTISHASVLGYSYSYAALQHYFTTNHIPYGHSKKWQHVANPGRGGPGTGLQILAAQMVAEGPNSARNASTCTCFASGRDTLH